MHTLSTKLKVDNLLVSSAKGVAIKSSTDPKICGTYTKTK